MLAGAGFAAVLAGIALLTRNTAHRAQRLALGSGGLHFGQSCTRGWDYRRNCRACPRAILLARQIWWIGTIIATGIGIYLIAIKRQSWAIAVGIALIIAPHVIGAPQPPTHESGVPAGLAAEFAANSIAAAAAFWCVIGVFAGIALDRTTEGHVGDMSTAKIPTTVITGFLGAGKTTLIRHLLQNAGGRRLGLLINEFGDVGVDGEILKACGSDVCGEDDIIELANGCICCTVADDFVPAMEKLLNRPNPPQHIVIETSGLALPQPLVRAFNWPEIKSRVTVDGVVAVVDAKALAEGRFADDEAALAEQRAADPNLDHDNPIEEVFQDQLTCADLVVLNKTDLLDDGESSRLTRRAAGETAIRHARRPGAQGRACLRHPDRPRSRGRERYRQPPFPSRTGRRRRARP